MGGGVPYVRYNSTRTMETSPDYRNIKQVAIRQLSLLTIFLDFRGIYGRLTGYFEFDI